MLRCVYYPHGLCFSADGRYLFVADAGAPYIHIYEQDRDEWRGVRHPVASVRVMDEAVFRRGSSGPGLGGPKGVDIDAGANVVWWSPRECQPLEFFRRVGPVAAGARGQFGARAADSRHQIRTVAPAREASDGDAGHGGNRDLPEQQVVADHRTIAGPPGPPCVGTDRHASCNRDDRPELTAPRRGSTAWPCSGCRARDRWSGRTASGSPTRCPR